MAPCFSITRCSSSTSESFWMLSPRLHDSRRIPTHFIHESYYGGQMTIAKVEVERFSLTSLKPFDAVVAALKSAVGQPNMPEFFRETRATNSFPDLERVVQRGLGRTGFMLFAEFDLGDILRRESGAKTPKIMRLVIGNPLIMKEMVKHVPDAGSYAPVTILVN